MGILGGPGAHAAYGMRIWSELPNQVGFPCRIGSDLASNHVMQLRQSGINLAAAAVVNAKHPRAWNLFEKDGRRQFLYRTSEDEYKSYFRISPEAIPGIAKTYPAAKGVHLLCGTDRLPMMITTIAAHFPQLQAVIWEPSLPDFRPEEIPAFRVTVPLVPIFSPTLEESARLLSRDVPNAASRPKALCRYFRHNMGAKTTTIAMRMGEKGSLVYTLDNKFIWVPPFVEKVADITGVGNSYCGGFLVGWLRTRNPAQAAMYGAVSASFTLEQWGLPSLHASINRAAASRLEKIAPLVVAMDDNDDETVGSQQQSSLPNPLLNQLMDDQKAAVQALVSNSHAHALPSIPVAYNVVNAAVSPSMNLNTFSQALNLPPLNQSFFQSFNQLMPPPNQSMYQSLGQQSHQQSLVQAISQSVSQNPMLNQSALNSVGSSAALGQALSQSINSLAQSMQAGQLANQSVDNQATSSSQAGDGHAHSLSEAQSESTLEAPMADHH